MIRLLPFSLLTLFVASSAFANPLPVTCEQAANTLDAAEGVVLDIACPAGCNGGAVWGTDIYSDDSSMCAAAIHAGKIDAARGGTVRMRIDGGQASYAASTRNGVTTYSWEAWPRSFSFVGGAMTIDCLQTAQSLVGDAGTRMTLICPAGCTSSGTVWGTTIYSDDSAVCRAAIHAGVIGGSGGTFLLTIREGLQSYEGSTANDVTSEPWGAWARSFSVSQ